MAHSSRGFTLVEAAVVVAIVGLLAAVGFGALRGVQRRTQYSAAVAGLVADLNLARARAVSDQRSVYAVFLRSSTNAASDRYLVLVDGAGTFSLSTFDPAAAVAAPNVLVSDQTLGRTVSFGPADGYGLALPAPFAAVPASTAITFLRDGFSAPYDQRGFVEFRADETLRLSDGAVGGSITVQNLAAPGRQSVALVAQTAAVRGFER